MPISPELKTAAVEAEESLLGALLIEATDFNNEAIKEVAQIITPQDFSDAYQGRGLRERIFTAMLSCPHPDQVAVARELNRTGKLQRGDCAYLCHLVAVCPMSLDYMHYAEVVSQYSKLRNPGKKKAPPKKWGVKLD